MNKRYDQVNLFVLICVFAVNSPCNTNPMQCSNHGTCDVISYSPYYLCTCFEGYVGQQCGKCNYCNNCVIYILFQTCVTLHVYLKFQLCFHNGVL